MFPHRVHVMSSKTSGSMLPFPFRAASGGPPNLDGEVLIDYPKTGDKLVPIDAPLLLGREDPPALNRYYNGIIDEFALFNRGLSQDEN